MPSISTRNKQGGGGQNTVGITPLRGQAGKNSQLNQGSQPKNHAYFADLLNKKVNQSK